MFKPSSTSKSQTFSFYKAIKFSPSARHKVNTQPSFLTKFIKFSRLSRDQDKSQYTKEYSGYKVFFSHNNAIVLRC